MDPLKKHARRVKDFLSVCRRLAELLYVTSHGGNLAWKLVKDLILITPTKINKGEIKAKDLVFIDRKGKKVWGKRSPTGETPMYLNFFRERGDVDSVIHCHPPFTNAFAVSRGNTVSYTHLTLPTIYSV